MHRGVLLGALAVSLLRAQDLPDGKGKDLVQRICTECHSLESITAQRATKEGWTSIVESMVVRGSGGTKEELETIVDYLAKNFGKESSQFRR